MCRAITTQKHQADADTMSADADAPAGVELDSWASGADDAGAPRVMIIDDEVSAVRVGRSVLVIEADAARTCTAAIVRYTEDRCGAVTPGIYLEAGGNALLGVERGPDGGALCFATPAALRAFLSLEAKALQDAERRELVAPAGR